MRAGREVFAGRLDYMVDFSSQARPLRGADVGRIDADWR
jgi:hypothetical protein